MFHGLWSKLTPTKLWNRGSSVLLRSDPSQPPVVSSSLPPPPAQFRTSSHKFSRAASPRPGAETPLSARHSSDTDTQDEPKGSPGYSQYYMAGEWNVTVNPSCGIDLSFVSLNLWHAQLSSLTFYYTTWGLLASSTTHCCQVRQDVQIPEIISPHWPYKLGIN